MRFARQLLLTLLVGCSSTDKVFIQRRDDCAETAAAKKPLAWLINKYGLGVETEEYQNGEELTSSQEARITSNFCSFYTSGSRLVN